MRGGGSRTVTEDPPEVRALVRDHTQVWGDGHDAMTVGPTINPAQQSRGEVPVMGTYREEE